MANFNYTKMQATASRLLARFNQGVIEIGRVVRTPGARPQDPPTLDWVGVRVDGVLRGVSQQYVDGTEVLNTDLMLVCDVDAAVYTPGDIVRADGVPLTVIRHDTIPAAGVVVANRFIVRR